jgi:hypothetical protein
LEIFGIGNVGIFCGHLEYFSTIWYVSCPFGIFCAHLVTFSPFWYVVSREIWQPRSVAQTPRGTEKMLLKVNHQVSVFPVLHEVLVELGDPHGPLSRSWRTTTQRSVHCTRHLGQPVEIRGSILQNF